jgi:hypothetical protein
MRITALIIMVFIFLKAASQEPVYETYTVDTVYLKEIKFKKVVAYNINTVTFLVNYNDYRNSLYSLWKTYYRGMKNKKKELSGGRSVNPDYESGWRTVDSVYTILKEEARTQDTIFLSQKIFDRAGIGAMNNFFSDLIESGQCAILDENNKRHYLIIRHEGAKKTGTSAGLGGRAYLLPGDNKYFIAALDWVS